MSMAWLHLLFRLAFIVAFDVTVVGGSGGGGGGSSGSSSSSSCSSSSSNSGVFVV